MDDAYLDVTAGYVDDCKITQMQYRSFSPYSHTAMSNNDEIRISIQNMDAYTLPCESFIYIEGKIIKPVDVTTPNEYYFTNNGLAFLFSEMRYELNGNEIQKLKSPGISTCMKGYCSYSVNDLFELQNAAWDISMTANENQNFTSEAKFSGCIPLKHLFGFCEDYRRIMLNCNQQLILNRSSSDLDALHVTGISGNEVGDKYKHVTIELSKITWKMPIVKVIDREKLKLLRVLDSRKTLLCAFRTWDLCEYPVLPQNTSHSWTVKSTNLLEKPRFAIIGFQTNRKNNLIRMSGRFDSCHLKNLKVYLNSEVYPHEDFHADFTKKRISLLYKAFTDFQKSYYDKAESEPILSKNIFQDYVPLTVVDLSRQNDTVKSAGVDLRVEFETSQAVPDKTAAYCLILHDQVITYNPFSGDVRKL